MLKPNDFFIGVTELFAIFFPGFLVLFGLNFLSDVKILQDIVAPQHWLILIIGAYLVGCVFFAIGSKLDALYEKMIPKGNEGKLAAIDAIRKANWDIVAFNNVNDYKWSRSILQKLHTTAWAEVIRKEVDSKLFRSLVIPLLIFALLALAKQNHTLAILSLLMAAVSFIRYRDLRFKACRAAYEHAIVLHSLTLLKNSDKNS